MINHKFAKEYKIISKIYENFSKDKKVINICDNFFQKICCLSIIETENNHSLKFFSVKSLKLSSFILSLLIKFIEFFVVYFNIFFSTLIKLIKFFVVQFYMFV